MHKVQTSLDADSRYRTHWASSPGTEGPVNRFISLSAWPYP